MNDVLTIHGPKDPEDDLDPGMVGDLYRTNITASGGDGGYHWDLLNPYGIPSGLNLDKDLGRISGLPDAAAAGSVSLTVRVTDSKNMTTQRTFSLTINPALQVSRKIDYGNGFIRLEAIGGVTPYKWEKITFPDWLDLSEQGVITLNKGKLTLYRESIKRSRTEQCTVQVKDSAENQQHTAQASFSTTVRPDSWWRHPLHPAPLKTSGWDIKFRPNWRPSLGLLSQLTFWLAFLALAGPVLGIIPIFVYAFTTPGTHGTYLGVGVLTALASFLVGCLTGFLFGIPRVVSSGQARLATSSEYAPSSNLAEVSDWLTKLLLGAGLVQLTHLGTPISHLISHVAAGLHITGPYSGPATVMAGAIIFGYVTIGLLDGYVVTTIWYQKKLAALNF